MINGFLPGIVALAVTVILCNMVRTKHYKVTSADVEDVEGSGGLPGLGKAIVAPAISIGLLMLNPIGDLFGIGFINSENLPMDPFYVLPIGAVIGCLVMGKKVKATIDIVTKGALRMAPVVLMLFGAGAIGGLITVSVFPDLMQRALENMGVPTAFLAPLSSTIFSSAAGSNAAGVIIGGESFAATVLAAGVPAMAGAVMLHAGGGFLDIVPHGNVFLASQQGMKCSMTERIKVMPYEAIVGGFMTLTAVLMYLVGFWS
jgi:GntP family gluconate:H+ symporter